MIYGLPERLREMREKYNISQETVAERLGITPASISSYERGERTPSLPIILKISYVYNCSVDYLLGKSNDNDTHIYIDVTELSDKKRKAVSDLVEAIK